MTYDQAAETSSKAAYTSAGGTLFAGIALNEVAAIVGVIATIFTLGLNWYYKQKHLELARSLHRADSDE